MENASKALIMAGGVLIAIILVSLLVALFARINENQNTNEKILELKELAKFNSVYESYNKKVIYGSELISLINRTEEVGITEGHEIQILYGETNQLIDEATLKQSPTLKRQKFECVKIEYNENGKVIAMRFKEETNN